MIIGYLDPFGSVSKSYRGQVSSVLIGFRVGVRFKGLGFRGLGCEV